MFQSIQADQCSHFPQALIVFLQHSHHLKNMHDLSPAALRSQMAVPAFLSPMLRTFLMRYYRNIVIVNVGRPITLSDVPTQAGTQKTWARVTLLSYIVCSLEDVPVRTLDTGTAQLLRSRIFIFDGVVSPVVYHNWIACVYRDGTTHKYIPEPLHNRESTRSRRREVSWPATMSFTRRLGHNTLERYKGGHPSYFLFSLPQFIL
ncbi:hypothetical protein B0H34DRAFT_193473 [Crassisporium funariophilum]|nr:hypothetical protein B0H34DRAFT_193473 [Crassisporium funariophilum]